MFSDVAHHPLGSLMDRIDASIDIDKEKLEFDNLEIVKSEYPMAGEMAGYHYAWKYKPFKKLILLHDSMFIKEKLSIINSLYISICNF
jgi:hypothetical protein